MCRSGGLVKFSASLWKLLARSCGVLRHDPPPENSSVEEKLRRLPARNVAGGIFGGGILGGGGGLVLGATSDAA